MEMTLNSLNVAFPELSANELTNVNGGDWISNLLVVATGIGFVSGAILGGLSLPSNLRSGTEAKFGVTIGVIGGIILITAGTRGLLNDAYNYIKSHM
ncbi:hypothetical protein [Clostridium grantii]|uniref:Uncharacterized protein n=1 Tax=Clostridium grantii DSM 8605 TaxID=1121316 RepID=A0A1M5YA72_9CLOT|nr:hypothetical protein [Clostridium grantii]SHI08882.1 hypothetical protein SAMN02745207_04305 [Clostridium grantii DSM 8605]